MKHVGSITSRSTLVLILMLARCGGASPAALPDLDRFGESDSGDIFSDRDVDLDDSGDDPLDVRGPDELNSEGVSDSGLDALPDLPQEPDPAFVFEMRNRPSAIIDDPAREDRGLLFHSLPEVGPFTALSQVAVTPSAVWLVSPEGHVFRKGWQETDFSLVATVPDPPCLCLRSDPQLGLLVCSGADLYSVSETDGALHRYRTVPAGPAMGAVSCGGDVFLHFAGMICRVDGEECAPPLSIDTGVILSAACSSGHLIVAAEHGAFTLAGDLWQPFWIPPGDEPALSVDAAEATVVIASLSAVAVLEADGTLLRTYSALDGEFPGLPNTCVAVDPSGSRFAVGHDIGATTGRVGASQQLEHFHSQRYIPGQRVNDLAFVSEDQLWTATSGGASLIYKETITLAEKAERMFATLNRWFWRLNGFVPPSAWLNDPWHPETARLYDDDNDGQWTQEAVAAFCYAYATTGDKRYYDAARRAVENMFLLMDVPGPQFEAAGLGWGFVARSVVRDDEGEIFDNKAPQSNWHRVTHSDGHDYYWKDDTSSDETTGHFFGWSIYHDLCAKDDEERAWVAHYLAGLGLYILQHGYQLLDVDGECTSHGYWQPERLAIGVDGLGPCLEAGHGLEDCADAAFGSAYVNSVQILGAMLASWHVSGDKRFLDAYESLISEYRYDELATFNEYVLTWTQRGIANYCDRELADLAFLTLVRYESNPQRRQMWAQSMLDAFPFEAEERNPLKTLAMASVLEDVPGMKEGVQSLRDYPLNLQQFLVDNSHRRDMIPDVSDRHQNPQFTTVLPYDELPVLRWDYNPYGVSKGGDGREMIAPTFWLLPYWGLRYHGVIVQD